MTLKTRNARDRQTERERERERDRQRHNREELWINDRFIGKEFTLELTFIFLGQKPAVSILLEYIVY